MAVERFGAGSWNLDRGVVITSDAGSDDVALGASDKGSDHAMYPRQVQSGDDASEDRGQLANEIARRVSPERRPADKCSAQPRPQPKPEERVRELCHRTARLRASHKVCVEPALGVKIGVDVVREVGQ